MAVNRHIIAKQIFDLTLAGGTNGYLLQEKFSRLYWQKVAPALSGLFDQLAEPNILLRIERLELDLGEMNFQELDAELANRLVRNLESKLKDLLTVVKNQVQQMSVSYSHFAAWLYFLENGTLPWTSANLTEEELHKAALETIALETKAVDQFMQLLQKRPHVIRRLAIQHPAAFLKQLTEAVSGRPQTQLAQLAGELDQLVLEMELEKILPQAGLDLHTRHSFWINVFQKMIRGENPLVSSGLIRSVFEETMGQLSPLQFWNAIVVRVRDQSKMFPILSQLLSRVSIPASEPKSGMGLPEAEGQDVGPPSANPAAEAESLTGSTQEDSHKNPETANPEPVKSEKNVPPSPTEQSEATSVSVWPVPGQNLPDAPGSSEETEKIKLEARLQAEPPAVRDAPQPEPDAVLRYPDEDKNRSSEPTARKETDEIKHPVWATENAGLTPDLEKGVTPASETPPNMEGPAVHLEIGALLQTDDPLEVNPLKEAVSGVQPQERTLQETGQGPDPDPGKIIKESQSVQPTPDRDSTLVNNGHVQDGKGPLPIETTRDASVSDKNPSLLSTDPPHGQTKEQGQETDRDLPAGNEETEDVRKEAVSEENFLFEQSEPPAAEQSEPDEQADEKVKRRKIKTEPAIHEEVAGQAADEPGPISPLEKSIETGPEKKGTFQNKKTKAGEPEHISCKKEIQKPETESKKMNDSEKTEERSKLPELDTGQDKAATDTYPFEKTSFVENKPFGEPESAQTEPAGNQQNDQADRVSGKLTTSEEPLKEQPPGDEKRIAAGPDFPVLSGGAIPLENKSLSIDQRSENSLIPRGGGPGPVHPAFSHHPQGAVYYLSNAGVILSHAFLKTFFEALNLVKGKEFTDEISRHKAVHLIEYLATGKLKQPEYELVLPKFLCNLPLETPLIRDVNIQEQELAEAEDLLAAMITHWGALGNASNDALREGFLQRNGKLERRANGWYLVVERVAMDILLNRLPWNRSMVQLPWMQELLRVEWG